MLHLISKIVEKGRQPRKDMKVLAEKIKEEELMDNWEKYFEREKKELDTFYEAWKKDKDEEALNYYEQKWEEYFKNLRGLFGDKSGYIKESLSYELFWIRLHKKDDVRFEGSLMNILELTSKLHWTYEEIVSNFIPLLRTLRDFEAECSKYFFPSHHRFY